MLLRAVLHGLGAVAHLAQVPIDLPHHRFAAVPHLAGECPTDTTRLRRGGAVFDNLYQSFVRPRRGSDRRGKR